MVIACLWTTSFVDASGQRESVGTQDPLRAVLLMAVELASDAAPNEAEERRKVVDALYDEMVAVETEILLARRLGDEPSDVDFKAIVAAQNVSSVGYLAAARESYARYGGALVAGDREWTVKQITAARKYAALAAERLRVLATKDEERAASLRGPAFAVRRGPERAQAFFDELRRSGFNADQREILARGGLDARDITTYQQLLLASTPDRVGVSLAELATRIARVRRSWANVLQDFARGLVRRPGPLSESFLVGNPSDHDAVLNLFIKRAAVSPRWVITLDEMDPASGESPGKALQEVEKGKHYQVRLPARGEIRLVSIVTPDGVVAENTTARWAIEGRIDDVLLGGIVQEVHVAGFLPDLQLPGVASTERTTTASRPQAATSVNGWKFVVVSGVIVLIIVIAVAIARARKRA